ncbi:hypothetical protein GZ77_26555 [Endozoicomonas montiporae]|uniref:Phage tail tape measure protein domain-containing protein n=1 Tax=Endozoicomonas montiporae TaxID=1027273 RepID=A0A081MYF0_9GAMM|nr:phage tail tape measure protein [Endozoicomonas montiporae]KEQ11223.1 hypothetical protein GZ77_26555 [Endozoicomonas montiporae]
MAKEDSMRLNLIMGLVDQITEPVRKVTDQTSKMSDQIKKTQTELKQLGQSEKDVQHLKKLTSATSQTGQELERARLKAQMMTKEMSGLENPTKKQTKAFNDQWAAVARLEEKQKDEQKQIAELTGSLNKAGVSTKNLNDATYQIQQQTKRYNDQLSKQQKELDAVVDRENKLQELRDRNKQMKSEVTGQMMGTVAAVTAAAAPVMVAANFEQSMADLGAISGMTKTSDEFKALEVQAKKLGSTTQYSASESAQAMQYLAMAGFKTNEILEASGDVLNLAAAGNMGLAEAADIASNILSGFNLEASKQASVNDVLANTFTTSNTNLQMLGETMKYVAPVASSVGASIEEVAGMTGLLGNVGIQGSQAGTALRAMFLRLASPTKEAASMLEELGIVTQDADGNLRSMPELLKEMGDSLDGLGSGDKANYLSKIFGTEAVSAVTELMNQANSGGLEDYINSLDKSGTAANIAASRMDTTQGAIKKLTSAGEGLAIALGSVLLPAVASVVGIMATMAGWLASMAERFPMITTAVVGLVAAIAALKIGLLAGKLAMILYSDAVIFCTTAANALTLSNIRNNAAMAVTRIRAIAAVTGIVALTAAQKAMAAGSSVLTGIQWALNAAMMANPIGLVVAGVLALIAAVAALVKYWDKVKGVFNSIKGALGFGGGDESDVTVTKQVQNVGGSVPAATGGVQQNTNQYGDIKIEAAPGMSEAQLAVEVRKQLDERDRENARKARARTYE